MNIQSALNSMLSDVSNVAFRSGVITHIKKTEDWFGDKPTKSPKLTKEEKKQNKTQEQYEKSGQAQADLEAEAAYNEQMEMKPGEVEAVQRIIEQTQTYQSQNENLPKRLDYTKKKPRILNRHGTIYKEVTKDDK